MHELGNSTEGEELETCVNFMQISMGATCTWVTEYLLSEPVQRLSPYSWGQEDVAVIMEIVDGAVSEHDVC